MKRRSPKHIMKGRAALLFIIFILSLIFLGYKLLEISFLDNNDYEQIVLKQQVDNLTVNINQVTPKRGSILDARGIAFAESNMVYSVIYDPAVLTELDPEIQDKTILFLSDYLEGVDEVMLRDKLINRVTSHYEVIASNLSYPEAQPIIQAKDDMLIGGVYFEEKYKREYPYGTMASDLVGFVRSDGAGLTGLEFEYDDFLTGTLGRSFGAIDPDNNVKQEDVDAVRGYDLTLNIDFTVQSYIEEAIMNFYEDNEAISVDVVMMNPQTGSVLGMASYPNFDLNDPYDLSHLLSDSELAAMTNEDVGKFRSKIWNNAIVTNTYEPGSTVKPFTVAMALEEHIVTEEDTFYCPGYKIPFDGHAPIKCHKHSGHGEQTLMESLGNSCNVAMMDIAVELGRDFFYDYQREFGFGSVTSIDFPGEQSGRNVLYTREKLNPVELQTSAFGQGFNVTPIQLITGFSALINGGSLYEPQIVDRITDENGRIIVDKEPQILRKVISEEVSDQMLRALREVVDEGTGKRAAIEGYSIGGKTGTAEKGVREIKDYIVSFVGFSPTVNPEVICLVVVDDPVGENVNSRFAAEIFRDIMEDVLPYLRVSKDYSMPEEE